MTSYAEAVSELDNVIAALNAARDSARAAYDNLYPLLVASTDLNHRLARQLEDVQAENRELRVAVAERADALDAMQAAYDSLAGH